MFSDPPNASSGSPEIPPPDRGSNPWENAFQEGELPAKNELSCGSVLKYTESARKLWLTQKIYTPPEELRQKIKDEVESYDLILRGPIQVAQGEKLIMAVSSEQKEVLRTIFGVSPDVGERTPVYALVQRAAGNESPKIEAEVKYVIGMKPKTVDNFVISQGLAKILGAKAEEDIKILETYQKAEDLNLDNLK